MRSRTRWAIGMTVLGVVTALVVLAATGSVVWSVVGLLGPGVVVNALVHPRREP